MQNGEDVIADVYEMREGKDGPPLAYKLDRPYTFVIQRPQSLFEEVQYTDEPTTLDQLDVQFEAFVPFSKEPHVFLPIQSVSFIYSPIDQMVDKYQELTANHAQIDVIEERSESVPDREDDGTGRGTVDSD